MVRLILNCLRQANPLDAFSKRVNTAMVVVGRCFIISRRAIRANELPFGLLSFRLSHIQAPEYLL
jgi:hypothetical protein